MNPGSSRRALVAALSLALVVPACNEKASPDVTPGAGTGTAASSATAASTGTATATATAAATGDVSATATAEPAPSTTAVASAAPTTTATVTAKSTATAAKPKPKPAVTADASASGASTAAPTASATAEPTATAAVEIPPPAEGSADAIAAKMDNIFVPSKKNFFAKFKQRLEQKVSGTKKESTGSLNVERPNKISFRYDPPNKNRVVSDGTTLKAYVAEDSQMFESKVNSSAYAGGLAFFIGGLLKTMSFTFNTKADYKDGYVLVGKPRAASPTYDYVMFYVNKALLEKGDPACIERIVIVDAQGNKNRFDFTEATFPASVPASEWEFTPPAGTNITKN